MGNKSYVLIDSGGHLYCVVTRELLVADPSTVKKGDDVQFKYGKTTYKGEVLSDFGKYNLNLCVLESLNCETWCNHCFACISWDGGWAGCNTFSDSFHTRLIQDFFRIFR